MHQRIRHLFRHISPFLSYFVLGCLLISLVIEFYLKTQPAMFNWSKANEGANIVIGLLLSVVGSFIFFVVADNIDKLKDRKTLEKPVNARIVNVMTYSSNMINVVSRLKAGTSFHGTAISTITKKETIGMVLEMLENPEQTPDGLQFPRLLFSLQQYGPSAAKSADEIVVRFPSYDLEITSVMDEIHTIGSGLAHIDRAMNEFRTRLHPRQSAAPLEGPFSTTIIAIGLFNLFNAIIQLVNLTRPITEQQNRQIHLLRANIITALDRVNETKGYIET